MIVSFNFLKLNIVIVSVNFLKLLVQLATTRPEVFFGIYKMTMGTFRHQSQLAWRDRTKSNKSYNAENCLCGNISYSILKEEPICLVVAGSISATRRLMKSQNNVARLSVIDGKVLFFGHLMGQYIKYTCTEF